MVDSSAAQATARTAAKGRDKARACRLNLLINSPIATALHCPNYTCIHAVHARPLQAQPEGKPTTKQLPGGLFEPFTLGLLNGLLAGCGRKGFVAL